MGLGIGQFLPAHFPPGRGAWQRHPIFIQPDAVGVYLRLLPAAMGLPAERHNAWAGRLLGYGRLDIHTPVGRVRILRGGLWLFGFRLLCFLSRIHGFGVAIFCVHAVVAWHRKPAFLNLPPACGLFLCLFLRTHQPIQPVLHRLVVMRFLIRCKIVSFLQVPLLLYHTNKRTYL
jgi:hypothetical protein